MLDKLEIDTLADMLVHDFKLLIKQDVVFKKEDYVDLLNIATELKHRIELYNIGKRN